MWEICLNCFEKYLSLRPTHVKHKRLFCTTKQENVVRSQLARIPWEKIPSVVASYLKLPDVACYTGHCLRRSSATLLADAGVDITTIKRHAGWKSTTVAEGYVENSIENKTKIANQVLVPPLAQSQKLTEFVAKDAMKNGVTRQLQEQRNQTDQQVN
ncbi:hypothetical protein NQ317_016607 [Molorchus minor]|uniref:Tyr recombinase domain-containing protein n=1 Tax=Molorchus minor TaxID=1323400 RepID=A0ABQ9JGU4_9CUCU|nr:hypothetical protein NQ317_016607 [Molorchus minor]